MADPFSFDTSDPNAPGFLGQPVGFWRDLASFGGNLAADANARTGTGHLAYGTGFAGPFGAATSQTMEQGRQNALSRSALSSQAANTQGTQIENMLKASGLPLALARNQMLTHFYQHPELLQQMSGGGLPVASSGAQPDSYTSTIANKESGGNPNATNPLFPVASGGPAGPYQFIASTWNQFAQANPQYFSGKSPQEILAMRTDPDLSKTATQWLAAQNAPVLQSAGLAPTQQNLAIAHALGGQGAAMTLKYADNTPLPQVFQETQPKNAAAILTENPQYQTMTVGQLKQKYAGPNAPPTQYASAGNVATDASPAPRPTQPQGTPQQTAQAAPNYTPQQALGVAQQYEQQANQLELYKSLGFPVPGDPAALRQAAQQWRTLGLAGSTEGAKSDNAITTDRFGNRYRGNQYLGRGSEVRQVWNDTTKQYEWGDVGALGPNGQPAPAGGGVAAPIVGGAPGSGGAVAHPGPGQEGFLKAVPQIQKEFIDHDNKTIEGDLSHVIENVMPAKQQLFQLRGLIDQANPGAAGQLRSDFKNWVQTFAPDFVSQITGDASPAQEFNKIALMGAGKQERGDLGARGGFRAIEMYVKANPNLDMQPTANRDMANALLVSHQFHEDYARGATDFFNNSVNGVMNQQNPKPYRKVSQYDQKFIDVFRPQLYAAAIGAINQKPYTEWSKGLTPKQLQVVGGILQRTDPNAVVDLGGKQVPVTAFSTIVNPTDIMGDAGSK